jgi:hypothetical protein
MFCPGSEKCHITTVTGGILTGNVCMKTVAQTIKAEATRKVFSVMARHFVKEPG